MKTRDKIYVFLVTRLINFAGGIAILSKSDGIGMWLWVILATLMIDQSIADLAKKVLLPTKTYESKNIYLNPNTNHILIESTVEEMQEMIDSIKPNKPYNILIRGEKAKVIDHRKKEVKI